MKGNKRPPIDWKQMLSKIGAIILMSATFCLLVWGITEADKPVYEDYEEEDYATFCAMVEAYQVDKVWYNRTGEWMYFTCYNEETRGKSLEERREYKYKDEDKIKCMFPDTVNFREWLLQHDVILEVYKASEVMQTTISLLPSVVLLIFLVYLLVVMSKRMGLSGSPLDDIDSTSANKNDKRFSDVIGHDEVLTDLKFLVNLLQQPEKAKEIGIELPRGLLLSGPPGTGKTLIAKAVAGETKLPFLYMNASSFVEMYVGMGAKRVRELFKKAEKKAPCILFIDELDAVGRSRKGDDNSERRQTLNALLQELDGYKPNLGIFVMGATNDSTVLDKALVRAGRFDREIIISPPKDYLARKELLEYYLKDSPLADDVDLELFAKETTGFTGADIRTVVNEAALISLNTGDTEVATTPLITMSALEEALDKRITKGNRTTRETKEKERERVAYHEAGHAVMTWLEGRPIARATINGSTSGVGGFVLRSDKEDAFTTREDIEADIRIAYAGRAVEEIKYTAAHTSTGASSDIQQATRLISAYVLSYGFTEEAGLLSVEALTEIQVDMGRVPYEIIQKYSAEFFKQCQKQIQDKWVLVEKVAALLLDKETVSGDEVVECIKQIEG